MEVGRKPPFTASREPTACTRTTPWPSTPKGNLYGTTYYGGDGQCVDPSGYCFVPSISYGTVFQLKPGAHGWTENVLYSFPYGGDDLGYEGIGKSAAIKFDIHNNDGEGPDSTGLYLDGAPPILPAVSLAGTGIDLRSGDLFAAHIVYNGADLELTLTDTATLATWSRSFAVNLPATVGADTAFVGFTGGTGGLSAVQQILSWTFTNP